MYLLYSVYFLIAGLHLSSSAPAPGDCDRLVTPLDDMTKLNGSWYFIEGFADNEIYNAILKTLDSCWLRMTPLSSSNNTVTMAHHCMYSGTCNNTISNITTVGNTAYFEFETTKGSMQLLPSCSDCLVFSLNNTEKTIDKPIHTLYLLGRSRVLEESVLETFRMQAECLHFSLPGSWHGDPKKDLCGDKDEHEKI